MYAQNNGQSHRVSPRKLFLLGSSGLITLVLLAAWGIASRSQAESDVAARTEAAAVQTVATVKPKVGAAVEEVVLPGTVQAYVDAPLYARISGYMKAWHFDIGATVKKGQLLAEIDAPEVDDQLRQAQADLATAEANQALARSTSKRWQTLLATDSVAKQDADEKLADAKAKDAMVASAKANVARLTRQQEFERVVAPFDGVVTARGTDIGALINAGSAAGQELFHMADTTRLRIYVQVPQTMSGGISPGVVADLHFAEHGNKAYQATVARTSQSLDPAARTLLVELLVDNSKGELLPGGYTEVHFKLPAPATTVRVPVNTLRFDGNGVQVAKVDETGKVTLSPVVPGRDFGGEVEVVSGLAATDTIIVSPADSLTSGQVVRVAAAAVGTAPATGVPATGPAGGGK